MSGIFDLAEKLVYYRDLKKDQEEYLKDINQQIERLEAELAEQMITEEMQNFTRNGRQFILTTRTHINAKSGMMPAICIWMKENGLGDMVKEQVHPQTLQAWVKEKIEEAGALPEELSEMVNVYEKSGISIRKK